MTKPKFKRNQRVQHRDDPRRVGVVLIPKRKKKSGWNYVVVKWTPSCYVTQIPPSWLIVRDHPRRGEVRKPPPEDEWMLEI